MSSKDITQMAMAVLLAGIVALATGFIARGTVNPKHLEENVYVVDLGLGSDIIVDADAVVDEVPAIGVRLASADAGSGEGLSRHCAACHSFAEGGASRVGPNLWDIVDRPLAAVEGFSYSDALAGKGGAWTVDALDGFIEAPKEWASGTKMSYAGMRSAEDRADLIAWLMSLSGAPSADMPAEEAAPATEAAVETEAETVPEAAAESVAEVAAEAEAVVEVAEAESVAAASGIAALLAGADAGAGQSLSRGCAACHTFDEGGANRIGPNLWDVVNRPIGGLEGYSYSAALSDKGGTWTFDALDGFLAKPRDWASGTKMSYPGMRSAEDRANLIAWLMSLSGAPSADTPAADAAPATEAAVETEAETVPEAAAESVAEVAAETEAVAEIAEAESVAAVSGIAALLAGADAGAGQSLSRGCAACHTFDEGGGNRIGPNLWDIVNRPIGGLDGYRFSAALSDKGGTWTFDALDGFLAKPRDWAPGTKMSYPGMRSDEDRANLIAWLRSLSADPAPLPQ